MTAYKYLKYLQEEIHTAVAATVDTNGLPVTCAIDIMDINEGGLYFLTAKGKGFYNRLKSCKYISLTGIKGNRTMSSKAISVSGSVRELGSCLLHNLIEKNPYMKEIYPTSESQRVLTVFQIYQGSGEWFDLSKKPIERKSFTFGGTNAKPKGYFITHNCTGCRICATVCPQSCIEFTDSQTIIRQEHCLHCGNCIQICPQKSIIWVE